MPAYNPPFWITPLDLISFLGKRPCGLIMSLMKSLTTDMMRQLCLVMMHSMRKEVKE